MAQGFGIAALLTAIVAIFIPFLGIILSLVAIALGAVAGLAGDRVFSTATALIVFIDRIFFSPLTWMALISKDGNFNSEALIRIAIICCIPIGAAVVGSWFRKTKSN